jgi:hypothetical protein
MTACRWTEAAGRYNHTTGRGQLATAPTPRLGARCRIGQKTLAGASSGDGLAPPFSAVRTVAIEAEFSIIESRDPAFLSVHDRPLCAIPDLSFAGRSFDADHGTISSLGSPAIVNATPIREAQR